MMFGFGECAGLYVCCRFRVLTLGVGTVEHARTNSPDMVILAEAFALASYVGRLLHACGHCTHELQ